MKFVYVTLDLWETDKLIFFSKNGFSYVFRCLSIPQVYLYLQNSWFYNRLCCTRFFLFFWKNEENFEKKKWKKMKKKFFFYIQNIITSWIWGVWAWKSYPWDFRRYSKDLSQEFWKKSIFVDFWWFW